MSEYIERGALIKALSEKSNPWAHYIDAIFVAEKFPVAADVVEVVRCKDCVHYYEREPVCLKIYSDGAVHENAWQERKPDDFCSYGERKDGAE